MGGGGDKGKSYLAQFTGYMGDTWATTYGKLGILAAIAIPVTAAVWYFWPKTKPATVEADESEEEPCAPTGTHSNSSRPKPLANGTSTGRTGKAPPKNTSAEEEGGALTAIIISVIVALIVGIAVATYFVYFKKDGEDSDEELDEPAL